MFANIAIFMAPGARQAAPARPALAHANDNTKIVYAAAGLHRRGRPALACRWRPMSSGGFECYWVVEPANGSATEEADQRRTNAFGLTVLAYAA
jgi:hypothetical protein